VKVLRAAIEIVRPGSSLLLFAMLFVPLVARSHDVLTSLWRSIPMLLIGMCTFIANDLDDIESDKVNHPERPLPSRNISQILAAALYFVCLAAALLTTRFLVPSYVAFFYYLTITLTISYRYIVAFAPLVKAPYCAATIAIPAVILLYYNASTPTAYRVVLAVFAFALGRELCMDVVDRAGDARSVLHRVEADAVAIHAFVLQGASLLLILVSRAKLDLWAVMDLAAITGLSAVALVCWFGFRQRDRAVEVMKVQLMLGLYFLI